MVIGKSSQVDLILAIKAINKNFLDLAIDDLNKVDDEKRLY